ncbi:NADH dehydrogenase [ubiquinone] 1 alpha subcomplex assembly factor 4 [Megachile rotundata]|uniref:NADH dehydrogenase [ubiquinone] 1 alpha subcomplex assembly factor 4 n=1 Tax=Megachile rotundata TaxID=143995 RepID=UPI000258F2DD|nr:PREDICTED: protein NDUFAF4 homolog [Megachile rotundata]XP_012147617.1 PREDICTED: protein NDUFAF4 homolog [Megachile rotundata]
MGKVYSLLLRPIRTFNITNRVERVISKDKPTPAPQFPYVKEQKAMVDKLHPDFMETHLKKDVNLDNRLKQVFVTSVSQTSQAPSGTSDAPSTKPLPQDRSIQPTFSYGVYEPSIIPEGKCTLRQALEFIAQYNKDPTESCIDNIARTYKLDKEEVGNIVKHFTVPNVKVMSKKEEASKNALIQWLTK